MLDFVQIRTSTKVSSRKSESATITIYPEFIVKDSEDLMIRGGAFYAVWDSDIGMWSKDPQSVCRLVDAELRERALEYPEDTNLDIRYLYTFSTKKWAEFLSYAASLPDNYVELDSSVTFADDVIQKQDYVSKRLPYGYSGSSSCNAYEELISTLYDPIERQKLEWAIGSVFVGDSKRIEKFIVLYGVAGSGKSTVLRIIQQLFEGYYNVFEARALTSASNSFALEMFRDNPLVSIQHDGDLSRIEDNTKLNSIVSHEELVVNEKRKTQYTACFRTFLFMGTNKPVKITDAKSGIVRRLIDVHPSGRTLPFERYQVLMAQIRFELGAIARHCVSVYQALGMDAYNAYRPIEMLGATNDFYNFMADNYDVFAKQQGVSLSQVWAMYQKWAVDAAVKYPLSRRAVKEELKSYFSDFSERARVGSEFVRNVYSGFIVDKFDYTLMPGSELIVEPSNGISLRSRVSIFDSMCADCPAQYASADGVPSFKWSNVRTKLSELDTTKVHFVKVPENHIVIDFDIRDSDGNKDLNANLRAASKWPDTYAELSKSGAGVHLHYIYDGDISKLASVYAENIEIKVFTGNSSLRRKLTFCNDIPIATLSSGLPLKKGKGAKVISFEGIKNEKALRTLIKKNLRKEIHPATKPSVDFIAKILDEAYTSGMVYDVTDLRPAVMAFANNSTNNSLYCLKVASTMHFQSETQPEVVDSDISTLVFFDVEVFPNLFVVVWKYDGEGHTCNKMINPLPEDIELLLRYRLVGFNNRRYDNHILYARLLGCDNEQLYNVSQLIINNSRNAFYAPAYNLSYADIYDFSSKKQSLKKFEVELGIHHQELGFKWDEKVPENMWDKVADYCANDVIATEATFHARYNDFVAREILARMSGLSVNHTTRAHMTKIIFNGAKNPQSQFVYTDLSTLFPGYSYDSGTSTYRGEVVGEGGYVYAEPGYYENVALLDIRSMHPHSLIELNLFGPYTENFKALLEARLAIKDGNHDKARLMLGGALSEFIDDPDISDSDLAYALKIAINSVYGYTCASFDCEFKDSRNIDNIVAKRGALFMVDLKHEVQKRGFTVAHIKTDSIKVPGATSEIIKFICDYGAQWGYEFEHEATYAKMCLVNDAVYIAKYADTGKWTATGTQFAVPYVFKSLFSGEPFAFSDFCETKSVTGDSYLVLDMNENMDISEHNYRFVGKVGSFCPVKPGCGGGVLYRCKDDKYYAATGTKGYRWLESETVRMLDDSSDILDLSYYDKLVDSAVRAIEQFVSFKEFVEKE